jgi:hypothetical protein
MVTVDGVDAQEALDGAAEASPPLK